MPAVGRKGGIAKQGRTPPVVRLTVFTRRTLAKKRRSNTLSQYPASDLKVITG
jgi:hypothetical protein